MTQLTDVTRAVKSTTDLEPAERQGAGFAGLEWMRDDEGEGDPCRGPIDLDSGIVHIRAGPKTADPAE